MSGIIIKHIYMTKKYQKHGVVKKKIPIQRKSEGCFPFPMAQ